MSNSTHEQVQEYYGKTLQKSEDLKTNACCAINPYPKYIQDIIKKIHPEVVDKFYGCGLTIPTQLKGRKVLDLGSGSGRDCYILSALVGEEGEVVGVDMTDEQLDVANRHRDYHAKQFGHKQANTRFLKGHIEKLDELDLPDNTFDVIVSNCVINLSPDKEAVLREAWRVLKPGGELYFSDVYADRRVPAELTNDPVLYGECLSGALYWNDFENLAKKVGFNDPRVVSDEPITVRNQDIEEKVGAIKFYSITYRLFKIKGLEPACEDYGQSVVYKGTVAEEPDTFKLDDHHLIKKGEEFKVCGNTYLMLNNSRYRDQFEFKGDFSTHLGIFKDCGTHAPFTEVEPSAAQPKRSCC